MTEEILVWKTCPDLIKADLPHPDWIIPELVGADPRGYGVLAGGSKLGKSSLALQMGHSAATGTPFLCGRWTPERAYRVVYVMGDEPPGELRKAVERDWKDSPMGVVWVPPNVLGAESSVLMHLRTVLYEELGAELVLWDAFESIKPIEWDINTEEGMTRCVNSVKTVSDQSPWWTTHHNSKNRDRFDQDKMAGHHRLTGGASTLILLEGTEHVAVMKTKGRGMPSRADRLNRAQWPLSSRWEWDPRNDVVVKPGTPHHHLPEVPDQVRGVLEAWE